MPDLCDSEGAQSEHATASDFLILSPGHCMKEVPTPTSHQLHVLCKSYLHNVDPVFKILHAPSLRNHLQGETANHDRSPGLRGLEALKMAVCYAATVSITDGDCRHRIGENKSVLITRYRRATEQALGTADFVNALEMSTLQAFTIYLVSTHSSSESR